MPVLEINHPNLINQPKTYASAAIAASDTSMTVENTAGFAYGDVLVIGNVGEEKTEEIIVHANTGLTATALPTVSGGVSFAHGIGTPITRGDYDQIKIYSSATEAGTFAEIAASPIDIDWENPVTRYDETVGSSTTWYKTSFYHSVATTESGLSDAYLAAGYRVNSLGTMIARVRRLLRIPNDNTIVTDAEITDMLNESQLDLSAERNWPFLEDTFTDSTTDSTQTVALPSTMKPGSLQDINILYSSINYHPTYIAHHEFLRLDITDGLEGTQATITHYTIVGSTVYFFLIPDSSGSSDVTFYGIKVPDTLDELNEVSNFPETSYFVYDVAHQIAVSMGKEIKLLDRLESNKDRSYGRMMRYGTKQSTGPTRVRNTTTQTIDPNFFTTIESD